MPQSDRSRRAISSPAVRWVPLVICLTNAAAWAQPGPMGPPHVSVVAAQQRLVASTQTLVGSIEPYTRSIIASEVAGIVAEMPVDQGDRVEAGRIICRLRDTTARLAHAEAIARLQQLEAELAELEAGTRKEEIARTKAAQSEASALFDKWQHELERIKRLRGINAAASNKEYNDTVAEYAAANARLAQATASYEEAVAGPRVEEIARARHAVAAQRRVVDRLKYDLDQTAIRSPFAGYVTQKYTELGQWIESGGKVVELIDLDRVLIRVDVPESAISAAKVGRTVGVTVDALARTFSGRIKHVIPQADQKARTFPVEVELANPDTVLKSGMFVRARVPAGPTVESVIVPRDAILQRGRTHYVVIVRPASPPAEGVFATPVPVELGAEVGAWIAIRSSAVREQTRVVVKGHDRIFGPQPVQTQPATVPPPRVDESPVMTSATSKPASVLAPLPSVAPSTAPSTAPDNTPVPGDKPLPVGA